jgi:hypothetical protein
MNMSQSPVNQIHVLAARRSWKIAVFAVSVVTALAMLWPHSPVKASAAPVLRYNFVAVNVSGSISTIAYAINRHGDIVGTYIGADNAQRRRGFLKNGGGFTPIDFPGGDSVATSFTGINTEGHIVGTHSVSGGPAFDPVQGFFYDGTRFTDIHVPGDPGFTLVRGINAADEMVGSTSSSGGFGGFLYARGKFSSVAAPGNVEFTAPWSINDLGTIAGSTDCNGGGCEAGFVDHNGQFTTILMPSADASGTSAQGMNNHGHVAGNWIDSNLSSHGFVDIGGNFTSIDFPGAEFPNGQTVIWGINDQDQIVGHYSGGDCKLQVCGFVGTRVQ